MTSPASISTSDYRRAVSKIIRDIQAGHSLTDLAFAESIGCCIGTVRNAREEKSDLGAIWLTRIEARYGTGAIDPYMELAGARSVPLNATAETDPLPAMTAAVHRLAVARSPDSPGGSTETRAELFEMLPDMKALQQAVTALVCRIQKLRDGAAA